MVRLSSFAVVRLMTSSNFMGCSSGKSASLAPLRILSTKVATCRKFAGTPGPYAMRPPAFKVMAFASPLALA
jgi:hypothetical protein